MEFLEAKLASAFMIEKDEERIYLCLKIKNNNKQFLAIPCMKHTFYLYWFVKTKQLINKSMYQVLVDQLKKQNSYINGLELNLTVDEILQGTLLIQNGFKQDKEDIISYEGVLLSDIHNIPIFIERKAFDLYCTNVDQLDEKQRNNFINEVIDVQQ